jgi:transposase
VRAKHDTLPVSCKAFLVGENCEFDLDRIAPFQSAAAERSVGCVVSTHHGSAVRDRRLGPRGRALNPARTVPDDPDIARLADLGARRGVLTGQIRAEKNRLQTTRDDWLFKEISRMIHELKDHLAAV